MVLDAWKDGSALRAPGKLITTAVGTAIQPIKTRMKQNKMIKTYVDRKIDKDEQGWKAMDRSENNIISEKKKLDKKIKDKLKGMGSY